MAESPVEENEPMMGAIAGKLRLLGHFIVLSSIYFYVWFIVLEAGKNPQWWWYLLGLIPGALVISFREAASQARGSQTVGKLKWDLASKFTGIIVGTLAGYLWSLTKVFTP